MATLTRPAPVTLAEFDEIFESVKNWGRWGADDELGTLNFITPAMVRAAAGLVTSGRQVTMAIPMNKAAGRTTLVRSCTTWSRAMTSTSAQAQ